MKHCNICGTYRQLTEFSKNKNSKDGLSAKCKICSKEYDKAYYLKHQEVIKARTEIFKKANPDKIQAGKVRYRAKNREKINDKLVAWYAKNRDQERFRCATYHANNPNVALERGKRWVKSNPEANKAKLHRRRARKLNAAGTYNADDLKRIFEQQRGLCIACRCKLTEGNHVDHIIALSKGGTNWPSNIQILCPSCNRRKGAKPPEVFMREIGYLI